MDLNPGIHSTAVWQPSEDIWRFFNGLRDQGCPWNARTCSFAAEGGRLEVLKWTREHGCACRVRECRPMKSRIGYPIEAKSPPIAFSATMHHRVNAQRHMQPVQGNPRCFRIIIELWLCHCNSESVLIVYALN